ncbi:MAG TPA: hypothetical protein VFZ17_09905 [Acidimicrobiia bacterium]|nr:hypothetical protein [Acidimicrobiia bacterium]
MRMWKALPKPVRRWLFLAVLLPFAAWGLERLGNELAAKRGESGATKAMRAPRQMLRATGIS